jgi:hypothetical protein
MIIQVWPCPNGQGSAMGRQGQTRQDQPRYCCREQRWAGRTFLVAYA